jgi:hypothetical protein
MTYPSKVSPSRFDVEIQKIKDYTVREVAKASVVNNKSLASINHLAMVSMGTMRKQIAHTLM